MILKSSIRGNGLQFADYLEHSKKNQRVRVLDISGTTNPDSLRESLFEMAIVSDNTRSEKALLQVVINPAAGEGRMMTDADWIFCMDTIERHIGFNGQPRGGVEHLYKGEPHVHAFWSRYDPKTGKMLPISHIAEKLKAARIEIENELGHEHLLSWQEKKQQKAQQNEKYEDIKTQFSLNLGDIEEVKAIEPQPESMAEKLRKKYQQGQSQDQGMTM